jgi:hypothetical protein
MLAPRSGAQDLPPAAEQNMIQLDVARSRDRQHGQTTRPAAVVAARAVRVGQPGAGALLLSDRRPPPQAYLIQGPDG